MLNNAATILLAMTVLVPGSSAFAGNAVEDLLAGYRSAGAGDFSAARGQAMWTEVLGGGTAESCAACHTDDPTEPGSHVKTGKPITPMAPSVNPERLTDASKIEKWFARNCKGTWGRECTVQEKGDFLLYLSTK